MSSEDYVQVKIPAELHRLISARTAEKGFSSVDDFVTYVLRVAVGKTSLEMEASDTAAVTARLKALGYI